MQNPLRLPCQTASEPSKVVQTCAAFNILTWKCASRRNGVRLFNISTSKRALRPSVFSTFDFEMCFAPRRRTLFDISTTNKSTSQLQTSALNLVCFAHFDLEMCCARQQCALFRHLNFKKVSRTWCALHILTWKCALRISTSKSGPSMVCFVHFDFEMRFSLTACTFSTSQLPKCSEREVFLAFPLANVLRATTACNFSRSHPARWLRTRRSSEPTFRSPGATNH